MKIVRLAAILLTLSLVVAVSPSIAQKKKIVVSDFSLTQVKKDNPNVPKGWTVKVWQGRPDIKLVGENGKKVLRMRSEKAAISIYREIKHDLKRFPILTWRWKVTKLPKNADARDNTRDDQAAGVYVIFPRFPSFINSQLIGYIWETSVPEGTILQSRKNAMVHYIVVRSGGGKLDKWITEKRNVLNDYRRVFGTEPPKVGGISLMIDTDDTRSKAESYFAKIEFGKTASASAQTHPPNNKFVKFMSPQTSTYE